MEARFAWCEFSSTSSSDYITIFTTFELALVRIVGNSRVSVSCFMHVSIIGSLSRLSSGFSHPFVVRRLQNVWFKDCWESFNTCAKVFRVISLWWAAFDVSNQEMAKINRLHRMMTNTNTCWFKDSDCLNWCLDDFLITLRCFNGDKLC